MSNQTTAVQTKPKITVIQEFVRARQVHLTDMAKGTGLNMERFMALAFNAVRKTPALADCTPESWMTSLQTAATHGLLPDGVHGALVPYGKEATFVPMAQGLVQRAYQTKMVDKIWAEVVYTDDVFKVQLGTDPMIEHIPASDRGDPDRLVAAYACAIVNGTTHFTLLSKRDVMRHMASSKTASRSDGPWKTHTAEMFKKTAINVLSKTLPHFHADAQKFAELVHDSESDDMIIDIPASALTAPEPAAPKAPLQDVKEKLRQTAPAKQQPATEAPDVAPTREPGDDAEEASEVCTHPEVVAAIKAGTVTIASEPPTCKACGESIEPPDLGKLIEMYAPKTAAAKKQDTAAAAPCSYHERFKGRKIPADKVLKCPQCDKTFDQAAIDALGPKQ